MKMELTVLNEETGECELDLDDEAKDYLIQLGFETLVKRGLAEMIDETNR